MMSQKIVSQKCKTNVVEPIPCESGGWWIDAIELPLDKTWHDVDKIEIIGNSYIFQRMYVEPLLVITGHNKYERLWHLPFFEMTEHPYYINTFPYIQMSVRIVANETFEVNVFHGETENQEAKTEFRSRIIEICQKNIIQNSRIDCTAARPTIGLIIATSHEINGVRVNTNGINIINYNETMLRVYGKILKKKWLWNDPNYHAWHHICKKYHISDNLLKNVEHEAHKQESNMFWYWVPFNPGRSIWDWESAPINMSKVDHCDVELFPTQRMTGAIYYVNYNLLSNNEHGGLNTLYIF
jgi:hypothetical protein